MVNSTILVVDDDPQIIDSIVHASELESYTFYHANNIRNAQIITQKKNIDLVLTDWDMPEGSGIDLIRALKSSPQTAEIPVIMLTGVNTNVTNLSEAFNVGAEDFIRKPFNTLELSARVKSTLKIYQLQRERIEAEHKMLNEKLHMSMEMTTQKVADLIRLNNRQQKVSEFLEKLEQYTSKSGAELIKQYEREQQIESKEISNNEIIWYFEQYNPFFLKMIQKDFPTLTKKEHFLCILVCLNLSNKEIAELLTNSESTIKTDRKRLRQKLTITAKQELKAFLMEKYNLLSMQTNIMEHQDVL